MREYQSIVAGELLRGNYFAFSNEPYATVFEVSGIGYGIDGCDNLMEVICNVWSDDSPALSILVTVDRALYLVRFPESIRADQLQAGDGIIESYRDITDVEFLAYHSSQWVEALRSLG